MGKETKTHTEPASWIGLVTREREDRGTNTPEASEVTSPRKVESRAEVLEFAKYTWCLGWVPSHTAFLGLRPRTPDPTHSICSSLLHKAQLRQTLANRDQALPGDSPGFPPSMSSLSLQNWPIGVCPDVPYCWFWGRLSGGISLCHLEDSDLLFKWCPSTCPLSPSQVLPFPSEPPP